MNAEPSRISLRSSPPAPQGPVVIDGLTHDINGLEANITYRFYASFSDGCGNISAVAVATTLPTAGKCRVLSVW